MESVLLYLGVSEGLEYPPTVGTQEVDRHVGVEVQVVRIVQKVSVGNGSYDCTFLSLIF